MSGVAQPVEDAFNFLTAGTESTAYTLSSTVFHILNNPQVLKRLRKELDATVEFIRDDFNAKQIQALPYLVSFPTQTLGFCFGLPLTMTSLDRGPCLKRPCDYQQRCPAAFLGWYPLGASRWDLFISLKAYVLLFPRTPPGLTTSRPLYPPVISRLFTMKKSSTSPTSLNPSAG